MKKYLLNAAYELDGHAGSTSCYLQTDSDLTRPQARALIEQVFGSEDTVFEEVDVRAEGFSYFYGELVTTVSKDFVMRTPISISITVLPSKLSKNKVYLTESRTG